MSTQEERDAWNAEHLDSDWIMVDPEVDGFSQCWDYLKVFKEDFAGDDSVECEYRYWRYHWRKKTEQEKKTITEENV